MATIKLKNISKSFQAGIEAVKDVSFVAEEGEFIVLVGPSGCGKTTILRMIAGLEGVTSGELLINDIIANNFEPMDRNIGMVFQEYALYPHLSVFDNLAFPLKVQRRFAKKIHSTKLNKEEIKKLVLDIAQHLELIELIHRKPKELSGGQRQRVALGRAIIRQPDLFLFDEPLSNLDARLRILMRQEIISLQRKYGITSIYVTHDQTEAMTMGSKIAVMKDGSLQQFDTPYNIYHRPINKFVADFIGMPSIDFFNGTINKNVFVEDISNIIIDNIPICFQEQQKITLAIRPENIKIDCNEVINTTENNIIKIGIIVDNIEFLGNETIINITSGNTQKRIRTAPIQSINIGETINCYFNFSDVLIFNEECKRIYPD
jgi:multiple sugar transport system ATP-binding protein